MSVKAIIIGALVVLAVVCGAPVRHLDGALF